MNPETKSQAIKTTYGIDENCYFMYQHQTKWLIHYFGDMDTSVKETDFNYIAFHTLLTDLLSGNF